VKSRVAANTAIDRTNLAQALPSLPRQAPSNSEQWQSSWPRPPGYSSRQGRQRDSGQARGAGLPSHPFCTHGLAAGEGLRAVLSACLISWDHQPLNRRTTITIISIVPSPPP